MAVVVDVGAGHGAKEEVDQRHSEQALLLNAGEQPQLVPKRVEEDPEGANESENCPTGAHGGIRAQQVAHDVSGNTGRKIDEEELLRTEYALDRRADVVQAHTVHEEVPRRRVEKNGGDETIILPEANQRVDLRPSFIDRAGKQLHGIEDGVDQQYGVRDRRPLPLRLGLGHEPARERRGDPHALDLMEQQISKPLVPKLKDSPCATMSATPTSGRFVISGSSGSKEPTSAGTAASAGAARNAQ
mmetsp:Transcript_26589/g.45811  ORF Transcript_26589/g.45811 Transcript_26589/m.45811 type:complete len:244 (-) Transcript_26589:266-997(-)